MYSAKGLSLRFQGQCRIHTLRWGGGGAVSPPPRKKIFRPFGPQFGPKTSGGEGGRAQAPPLDPPLKLAYAISRLGI